MTDKIPLLVGGFFLSTILKSSANVPPDTKHTLSVRVAFSENDQGLLQMMLSLFQDKVDYFPGARGRSIRSGESLLLKFINGVHPSVEQPLDLSGLI